LEPAANDSFLAAIAGNGMKWYLRKDRNLTPIMLAADTGNIGLARALLDAGASTTAWTAVNKTWPLNFASRKGDVSMMRLLLKKDPQVENQKIIVSLSAQRATVFNAVGEIIYTTRISSGKKGFATPKGTFVITNKYREWKSTIYDGASMPYFQRFSCSDFGFHQGVVPGYPASHGCLRVPAGNAQKLFSLTELGDRVIIK
jgi:lipoprotein-anchoring transpeptidase ErfK/SrfK